MIHLSECCCTLCFALFISLIVVWFSLFLNKHFYLRWTNAKMGVKAFSFLVAEKHASQSLSLLG